MLEIRAASIQDDHRLLIFILHTVERIFFLIHSSPRDLIAESINSHFGVSFGFIVVVGVQVQQI